MNRSTNGRESLLGGVAGVRNIAAGSQHRRGRSLTRVSPRVADENLDLFSRNRPTLSLASSDESDVSVKLGGVSVGPAKVVAARSKVDDLLLSSDGGKNDYDWLLTPPETPLFSSSNGREAQPTLGAESRSSSFVKSVSNTRPSRLSVTQSEGNHSSRPTRSSSATRPSLSTTQYNSHCSTKSSSILNTSSASVSSYIRPSIPPTRSPSTARNSSPSVRPVASHSSTPARLVMTNSTIEKTRPSQNSRSSTPNSRHQIQSNLHFLAARSTSRASTPTRRMSAPSLPAATTSIGRVSSSGRNSAPTSRPSSPGPRIRSSQHPVTLSDFPHETPPNLRTTLPNRPLSAGRSRPGAAVTVKGNTENPVPPDLSRRLSSPISTRGRVVESTARGRPIEPVARGRVQGNSHVELTESRKAPSVSELVMRRPVRTLGPTESTRFGRTISKKSLDMAIRHMDIKGSAVGIRTIPGTTLFPQSIRSTPAKPQAIHALNGAPSVNVNGCPYISSNGVISENGNYVSRSPGSGGREEENSRLSAKLGEMDIFESSRYDTILLKEDLTNATWLHNVDDKSDQGPLFDGGFEPLPEPFGPL